MGRKFAPLLAAVAIGACSHTPTASPVRGVESVNVPVLTRTEYVFDVSAPGGALAPGEAARLDAWFGGLGLGYGDGIYVDGAYAEPARSQIAAIAGNYGLMVSAGTPVTAGAVQPGLVRVVVARRQAVVPNCPNWNVPANPNFNNRMLPNFGCAVNSNLAAMVANPVDLIHGQAGSAAVDAIAGAKAIQMYRNWPLTGVIEGQSQRPLKKVEKSTSGETQ